MSIHTLLQNPGERIAQLRSRIKSIPGCGYYLLLLSCQSDVSGGNFMIDRVAGKWLHLAPLALAALLTGCADNNSRAAGDGGAVLPPGGNSIETEQPMDVNNRRGATPAGTIELSASTIAPAIADLARRVGAAEADIRVLRAIPVIWNNGALGCPQPGQSYTQALAPGYWVVLEHQGRLYSYNAGQKAHFRLCETARPDPAGTPPHGRYNTEV